MTELDCGCAPGMNRCADVAWAAAIVEGEGSLFQQTSRFTGSDRAYVYPRISVSMSDRDILDRLQAILGVGKVKRLTSPSRPAHYRPMWTFDIAAYNDVIATLNLLLPWLGVRRRARAEELLTMTPGRVGGGGGPPFGLNNPATKLTDAQVIDIRRLGGTMSQESLARRFGCSRSQIGRILRNEARQTVGPPQERP